MGDGGAGKTALTIQYVAHHFAESYDPTIEDSYRRNCEVQNKAALVEILDTAGQIEFTALRDCWIREAEGFMLVYSITCRTSFETLNDFVTQIERCKEGSRYRVIVVGNKLDREGERKVTTAEGHQYAEEHGFEFIEASAKTRENVECAFTCLLNSIAAEKQVSDAKKGSKKRDMCTVL